jgi:hypothetical protein
MGRAGRKCWTEPLLRSVPDGPWWGFDLDGVSRVLEPEEVGP